MEDYEVDLDRSIIAHFSFFIQLKYPHLHVLSFESFTLSKSKTTLFKQTLGVCTFFT